MKKRVGAPRWCMQQGTTESDEARFNAKRSKDSVAKYTSSFEYGRESPVAFMVS